MTCCKGGPSGAPYYGHAADCPACKEPFPDKWARRRTAFMDALADYIDAKVAYASGDPEWRSSREVCAAGDKLEEALDALLKHD